jgi:hypothetical protein
MLVRAVAGPTVISKAQNHARPAHARLLGMALYATIWIAVALFVVGEAAKRAVAHRRLAWALWTTGAIACAVHMALAMGLQHGWSHDRAVEATAAQVDKMFGVRFGLGFYLNYVFLALWIVEAAWWRAAPESYFGRSGATLFASRLFFALILVNGAVIFVQPSRRLAGALLVVILLWSWRPLPEPAV